MRRSIVVLKYLDAASAPHYENMDNITLEYVRDFKWPADLADKVAVLLADLVGMGSALTAYSGGVDSTLLAVLSRAALGDRALAVTAVSASLPRDDRVSAAELATRYGLRHIFIETAEMDDPVFAANPPDRCYHCKKELFHTLRRLADEYGVAHILDGANVDDDRDFRPGRRAARENRVRSPLAAAGFSKSDIRRVSLALDLPTAAKPAAACLASRIPYGTPITVQELRRIDRAESGLRELGFGQVRVRSHADVARIELEADDIARAAEPDLRRRITAALRDAGYRYVTLDMEGYRTGSLNEVLSL